jgi:hypothetical protein
MPKFFVEKEIKVTLLEQQKKFHVILSSRVKIDGWDSFEYFKDLNYTTPEEAEEFFNSVLEFLRMKV